jgi:hypothetical protein
MHSQKKPFSSLLQLPNSLTLLFQAHVIETPTPLSLAETLPEDVLLEVAQHLSLTRDVLNMSLTVGNYVQPSVTWLTRCTAVFPRAIGFTPSALRFG